MILVMNNPHPLSSGVAYIFLAVEQLDAMIEFYSTTMGLDLYYKEEGICAFLRGSSGHGAALALFKSDLADGLPLFAVEVPQLEAISKDPSFPAVVPVTIEAVPGGRVIRIADPEGNLVELHESDHHDLT